MITLLLFIVVFVPLFTTGAFFIWKVLKGIWTLFQALLIGIFPKLGKKKEKYY